MACCIQRSVSKMLSKEELFVIKGGSFSAALLNSISRLVDTLLRLGQTVGSAIRRSYEKKYCKIS